MRLFAFVVLVLLTAGCRRTLVLPTDGGSVEKLRSCPTSGRGAMEGVPCFVLSPAETGLPADGRGSLEDQYALRPESGARGQLMLFFNGSGGSPRAGTGTSTNSWYGVSRAAGYHVLAVSYASASSIASLCGSNDACFEATRAAILTGAAQANTAESLTDLTADEGAFLRAARTLEVLARLDGAGGWSDFFDATKPAGEGALRWERIVVVGHSQGGGHAALVGKRNPVARVIMLAAPCENVNGAPASWLKERDRFATPPERFFGLGVEGDSVCPTFAANWEALSVPASQRLLGAACTAASPHGAPLSCANNAELWRQMLQ